VDTPANQAAARRRWAEHPQQTHLTGVTTFKAPSDSAPEQVPLAEINTMLLAVVVVVLQATFVLAQTPSPALLVLNKGPNEMAIVDPSAMKVVARVPVGEGPHEVATDGKLAFVATTARVPPATYR
jgi:YVTN family beta-propeller protein